MRRHVQRQAVERQTCSAYALWLGSEDGYYISVAEARRQCARWRQLGCLRDIWDEPQTLGRWCEYHYGASGNEVIDFRTYLGESCAWVSRTLIPYPESNG